MKVSHIGVIAVMLLVIAIACAGCTSTQTSTPAGSSAAAPAAGAGVASSGAGTAGAGAASPASGAASGTASSGSQGSGSAPAAGSPAGGAGLFGGLSYNFVEYKIVGGTNSQGMTIYFKYDKSGKCSMRFEGAAAANLPAGMQNIDCSSKASSTQTQANPNQVSSDEQVTCSGDESVTVPAGTFTATKCTVTTTQGGSETVWVVKNKFLVKMQTTANGQSMEMDLNSYG
jgi:hypothetical protein